MNAPLVLGGGVLLYASLAGAGLVEHRAAEAAASAPPPPPPKPPTLPPKGSPAPPASPVTINLSGGILGVVSSALGVESRPRAADTPAATTPAPAPAAPATPASSPGAAPSRGGQVSSSGSEFEGWIYPIPILTIGEKDYQPQISDGLGSQRDGGTRTHHGADLDYHRGGAGKLPQFPVGSDSGTKLFFAPKGTPVCAARDGKIWSVKLSPKGLQIVIDHGRVAGVGLCTYYQHLESVRFPIRNGAAGGPLVKAGQLLGIMGNGHNPGQESAKAFRHLHFEVWRGGGAESYVDAAPYLRNARKLRIAEMLP